MDDYFKELGVSRETIEELDWLEEQVRKWTPAINLISPSTLPDMKTRHIIDSAQVFTAAPHASTWMDIGSGGGFPGLVVAILAKNARPDLRVTLVDSDQRKCAFLRTIVRELSLNAQVLAKRIEQVPGQNVDVLSARALADLSTLLDFADLHLSPSGTALFQKGANWEKEIHAATQQWNFESEVLTSKTEPRAVLLKIRNIQRAS